MDYDFLPKPGLPMGKRFNCSHGHFELPSEIIGIWIGSDGVTFDCKDGQYFGRCLDGDLKEIHLKKIKDYSNPPNCSSTTRP